MVKQKTLKNSIQSTGIGLHSGHKVLISLKPAPIDSGIVFIRTDVPNFKPIQARPENVIDTKLSTTLGFASPESRISTVEHVMSALAGLGVDNAIVEVGGPEIPIMDGSSGPFVFLLQSVGLEEQFAPKKFIRVKKKVTVSDGDKSAQLKPFDGFRVGFTIDFDHPCIAATNQEMVIDFSSTSFVREISRARTFGFMKDIEALRAIGLARGGSVDNAIVIDEYRILNDDGLRYPDEFVRHKILDAIGDLYQLGAPLIGELTAHKSGHGVNNQLVRALMSQADAWEYVTFGAEAASSPIIYEPQLLVFQA